ncbi:Thymidylate kinase [uncultured archaeon]|nr:Thymidylate kinase [uncultured archaeon]
MIVFEGLPGTGKSTILFQLAKSYFGKYNILPEMHTDPGESLKGMSNSAQSRLFHKKWVQRMRIIQKYCPSTENLLLDRSFYCNLAFSYAFDKCNNSKTYSKVKRDYERDLARYPFELVLIFDTSPKSSIARRKKSSKRMEFPWTSKRFLKHVRDFYLHELPKICSGPYKIIRTENRSMREIYLTVKRIIAPGTRGKNNVSSFPNERKILLDYAKNNSFGDQHSEITLLFKIPTMYFGRNCIQLDKMRVHQLTNRRLKQILRRQTQ